jgi:hypothetical protein
MPLSSAIIFMAMVLGFWVGLDMDPITWPKSREGNLSVTSSQSHKLDPRGRKVKILATLGPASANPEMIRKLIRAGADAFRVNMSHADHATHEKTIAYVREAEKEIGQPISILCDLQGPKLRVGTFKEGRAVIRHSGHFTLDRNPSRAMKPASACRIPSCSAS